MLCPPGWGGLIEQRLNVYFPRSALLSRWRRHSLPPKMSLFCTFWIGAFVLTSFAFAASQRHCEVQGTCLRCEPGHFSSFVCHSDSDCFAGEFCVPMRGFCCPLRHSSGASVIEKCADGGAWERMCKEDEDCLFGDEVCAEGKCCPSCRQRRLQSLRETNADGAALVDRAPGAVIPQCSDDGKSFRPMQCVAGFSECYCVDKFGRKIGQKRGKTAEEDESGETTVINCTKLRKEMEEDKRGQKGGGHKTSAERDEPTIVAMSSRDSSSAWTQEGQEKPMGGREKPSAGRADRTYTANREQRKCADPLRVFRSCGSACPISCASRTVSRCPQEQCLRGCFCRLPHVVLDAADPFGSRCVLPAECPLLPFTSDLNAWNGAFFPALASPNEDSGRSEEKCADPLKNFQSCGSACAVGCGRRPRAEESGGDGGCSAQCVSGCFCRVPFLLRDPFDPDSECVLPQQCPSPAPPLLPAASPLSQPLTGSRFCPSSENKTWTSCFSRKCSLSCADPSPRLSSPCVPNDCLPGCQCYPPAIIKDKSAPAWECVLPENCPETDSAQQQQRQTPLKCEDPRKEFLTCGSSCPLGCDRLDVPSRTCSPCVSGCFCRNGFVFANASDWRSSDCVPVSQCPSAAHPPLPTALIFQRQMDNANEVDSQCRVHSFATNGPICESDEECGTERMCCATTLPSLLPPFLRLRRCVCADSHAVWSDCGPICAPSCTNSAPRLCAGLCRPGCYCSPGFVKLTDELAAKCVPMRQCNRIKAAEEKSEGSEGREEKGINGGGKGKPTEAAEKECGEAVASATLFKKDGTMWGRVVARPERRTDGRKSHRIRLSAEFVLDAPPPSELLLSIHHQFMASSEDCSGLGPPMEVRVLEEEPFEDAREGVGFGTVNSLNTELKLPRTNAEKDKFGMERIVESPNPIADGTNPMVGHSMSVKLRKTGEAEPILPMGCATFNITKHC